MNFRERTVQQDTKWNAFVAGFCALAMAAGLPIPEAKARDATGAITQAQNIKARTQSTRLNKKRQTSPTSGEGQYFIEFRSRYALSYGHTFAVFGRLNARGQIIESEVAGLHPAGDTSVPWTIGHLVPVPAETGASDGDLEDYYISNRYRILLSKDEYVKITGYIRQLKASSPLWHAALYNCNAFAGDIARFMGLRTPFTWLRPQQFIEHLREMNAGRQDAADTASYSSHVDRKPMR
jgi:hypothetical protein